MADFQAKFDAAQKEHNFGERCHKLAQLGKELKASNPPDLEALLDALVPKTEDVGPLEAFAEKARMIVAKAAGCRGYAKKLLDHPSKTVCFSAARDGLLQPADAKAAFLSNDSSRKLKKFLLKSDELVSDKEVLEHAWQLFGDKDKELFWPLLARAESQELLQEYLEDGKDMQSWLSSKNDDKIPGFPQLARKFPAFMVKMVTGGTLKWRWYWVKEILEQEPAVVLHAVFVEGHEQGSGPKTGYDPTKKNQDFYETLAHWGWRRKPELMFEICKELTSSGGGSGSATFRSKGKGKGMVLMQKGGGSKSEEGFQGIPQIQRLVQEIMSITSTRHALTMNKKIALTMQVWSILPQTHKNHRVALIFASLLPNFSNEEHRALEISNLIDAFWKMLGDVGRTDRQELLVGRHKTSEKPKGCTEFLQVFSNKLPPPLAVDQFFKILEEFEAGTEAYRFIQSNICKTTNGRHDTLMQKVFKKYLLKEDEGPIQAAQMFQVLLKDARSRDVIQTSFDVLTDHLDGHSELGLLQAVVQKMGDLEKDSRTKKQAVTPEATLPMPTSWLCLLELPEKALPHTQFLFVTLHTGMGPSELLGAMIAKYGPSFFWESLLHCLMAAQQKLLKRAEPTPALQVLKDVDVTMVEAAAASIGKSTGAATAPAAGRKTSKTRIGAVIVGIDGSRWGAAVADEGNCWKLDSGRIAKKATEGEKWNWLDGKTEESGNKYFANVADIKKKANVKDVGARLSGYSELMSLAMKEKDASKAFDDLLPFLISRFNAEQEQGRTHILSELFNSKMLPVKLWEANLEHLRNFWKLSSKARESASYKSIWNRCGTTLLENAIKVWGQPPSEGEPIPECPTEACLFGLEVAPDVSLPEVLVRCHREIKTLHALEDATRWVLQTAVPLSDETGGSRIEDFWNALDVMGTIKFCGEDPNAITSWSTLDDPVKVYAEKSLTSTVLGTKPPGTVVRAVQRGAWIELVDEKGFMNSFSAKTGLEVIKQDNGTAAEKGLWETYPFISEWWKKLLAQGVKQKAAEYLFVGILDRLTSSQHRYVIGDKKKAKRWWAPIECDEYKAAVETIMGNIESGEIPAKEGSAMLTERIMALRDIEIMSSKTWKVRATKKRDRIEDKKQLEESQGRSLDEMRFSQFPAYSWFDNEQWDVQKHKRYNPLPWDTFRCKDSIALKELETLRKLLNRENTQRQVLWQIAEVASILSGPVILKLVGDSIATLSPRFEGMARCVGKHYPYLNSALTQDDDQQGSSDVLTPLLELWLLDDSTRDACVSTIMKRSDFEYFLFFGSSFARHLSGLRQEWLQQCLAKLKAPGEEIEFYHYKKRGPTLTSLARYGKGEPGWRESLSNEKGSVQTYLWHPDTQAMFLEKALQSTEPSDLVLIPRLDFANGVTRISDLLGSYPKDQTSKEAQSDVWGFEVIQAAGSYTDIATEVERRFVELPEPSYCDKVDDPEVETLLTALGRADNAASAMKVLGPHAGKVKQAKEAVTKMIAQLGPPQARVMIRQVMLPKKAGVGLQVAGLKKIVDLRIPNPLELYNFAWRKGDCQRDVAGNILSRVATSPEFPPDEVKGYFDYFDRTDKQADDQAYVAGALLDSLMESTEWVLPFLPKIISKLAMLPGATTKAVQALKNCTSNVDDVVQALTDILRGARLAQRTEPKISKDGTDGKLLTDLTSLMQYDSLTDLVNCVGRKQLEDCNPEVLQSFLAEVMRRWKDAIVTTDSNSKRVLTCALSVWVKLIRAGKSSSWAETIEAMEKTLREIGSIESLGQLTQSLSQHAPTMALGPDEWDEIIVVLRTLFLRLIDGPLSVKTNTSLETTPVDSDCKRDNTAREKIQTDMILTQWVGLLAHGCSEQETETLFERCPEKHKVKLTENLVEAWWSQYNDCPDSRTAAFQQEKPDGGWGHTNGTPIAQIKVGSVVSGTVTNSSSTFGIYIDFGCEKDGKLMVPHSEFKKYRVGDRIERLMVNKVNVQSKKVDLLLVGSKGQTIGLEASKQVAKRAMLWIASSDELRTNNMATLEKLWAKLVSVEPGTEFESSLKLLGPSLPSKQCLALAQKVLDQKPKPSKEVGRAALTWLSKTRPADAVRLWPWLLQPEGNQVDTDALTEDVKVLLELCEKHDLELPRSSQVLAKAMPQAALELLCKSKLPEARLLAIQCLREGHRSGKPPDALRSLCSNDSGVVRAAARDLWVALGGKDEGWQKKKSEEEEEEEDEEED